MLKRTGYPKPVGSPYPLKFAHSWWGPAVLYASYVLNRLPSNRVKGCIPVEVWTGKPVEIEKNLSSVLKPFGAKAYVHLPDTLRRNYSVKSFSKGRSPGKGVSKGRIPGKETRE